MELHDLHWLAGLLEGEGSFMKPAPSLPNLPCIALQMTDEDIVSRACSLMGVGYYRVKHKAKTYYKDCFSTRLRGKRAVDLMEQLRPLMGKRRKIQIDNALASYEGDRRRTLSDATILEIRKLIEEGHSQWTISKKLGVNRSSIAMIAAGKRHAGTRV
jgi:type II secretory pathway component PulF